MCALMEFVLCPLQGTVPQNSEVYNPPTYLFHYTRIWKKISVGGGGGGGGNVLQKNVIEVALDPVPVVYFTVLCYHPCLVSLLFAVLVSLHPVTFSDVFYYIDT